MKKAIIPTKNRTDFELAKLTVTPSILVFRGSKRLSSLL
jgi:hypothetical protein